MSAATDRCMAVTGSVFDGSRYCGNPAKGEDSNGRPVCGVHRLGQGYIAWDEAGDYPNGPGGDWRFSKGAPR